jgi:hypothetical protein
VPLDFLQTGPIFPVFHSRELPFLLLHRPKSSLNRKPADSKTKYLRFSSKPNEKALKLESYNCHCPALSSKDGCAGQFGSLSILPGNFIVFVFGVKVTSIRWNSDFIR